MPMINEYLKKSILEILKNMEEIERLKANIKFLSNGVVQQLNIGVYSLDKYVFEITLDEKDQKVIKQVAIQELIVQERND